MERLVIVGSAGQANNVIDAVESEGKYTVAGFLDRFREVGEPAFGYSVLGREEDLPELVRHHGIDCAVVAIGDNYVRSVVAARVSEICPGLPFATTIHPRAYIAKGVSVGEGTVVLGDAYISRYCSIGRHCFINVKAVIGHGAVLGDFSSVMSSSTVGGDSRIGSCTSIGIGATAIHRSVVGDHVVIGAGAVVVREIPSFTVAFGNPARVIRERKPGDRYL